jgi:hypothetical protein
MISLPEDKLIYSEIQKKLFYIIPERWESIYLYTSIMDVGVRWKDAKGWNVFLLYTQRNN